MSIQHANCYFVFILYHKISWFYIYIYTTNPTQNLNSFNQSYVLLEKMCYKNWITFHNIPEQGHERCLILIFKYNTRFIPKILFHFIPEQGHEQCLNLIFKYNTCFIPKILKIPFYLFQYLPSWCDPVLTLYNSVKNGYKIEYWP